MVTICEKHDDALKIANQKFYRGSLDFMREEDLMEIIYDMESYFSDISDLISESKVLAQSMEDGLRRRKEFMQEKGIEEEYKS